MPRCNGISVILFLFLLSAGFTLSHAQIQGIEGLRSQLDGLQKKADALLMERIQNENAIGLLAGEITALKSQNSLSLSESDKLDRLLKKTVVLKKKSDDITNNMHTLQQQRKIGIKKLIGLIDHELSSLSDQIRKTPDKKSSSQYLALLDEKKQLHKEIAGFDAFFTPQIEISPNDDYEALYLKADFLFDQADKLKAFLTMLTNKISELEEEKEIRELTNNFMSQVFIFDEDKELKFSSATGNPGAKTDSRELVADETLDELTETDGGAGGHSASSGLSDGLQIDEIGRTVNLGKESVLNNLDQIDMSSSEDMALIIKQLRNESKTLLQQVDFLVKKAEKLNNLAKDLENELDH